MAAPLPVWSAGVDLAVANILALGAILEAAGNEADRFGEGSAGRGIGLGERLCPVTRKGIANKLSHSATGNEFELEALITISKF